jgi:hypothetical protein
MRDNSIMIPLVRTIARLRLVAKEKKDGNFK